MTAIVDVAWATRNVATRRSPTTWRADGGTGGGGGAVGIARRGYGLALLRPVTDLQSELHRRVHLAPEKALIDRPQRLDRGAEMAVDGDIGDPFDVVAERLDLESRWQS